MIRGRRRAARRAIKDRVLHARIPEPLDRALRERADQLGLSVSTVVRNALLHTFDLVEGIVTDSVELARALHPRTDARAEVPSERQTELPVLGWQDVVLNRNAVCEHCNAVLPRGARAAVGIPASARPAFLCLACLAGLRASPADAAPDSAAPESGSGTPE